MALTVNSAPTLTSSAINVQHVRYTVTFTVGAALAPGGSITIKGPTGTVMPLFASVHDNTANTTFPRSGIHPVGDTTAIQINLCCSDVVNAGDSVTVTLDDVTNGSVASAQTLDVSTSAEPAATSPPYTLTAQEQVTNVTALLGRPSRTARPLPVLVHDEHGQRRPRGTRDDHGRRAERNDAADLRADP
jgi:hypothetical protein